MHSLLTPQQVQIARLVSEGYTNDQIAAELGLGLSTVKNHVNDAYTRLGFKYDRSARNPRVMLTRYILLECDPQQPSDLPDPTLTTIRTLSGQVAALREQNKRLAALLARLRRKEGT